MPVLAPIGAAIGAALFAESAIGVALSGALGAAGMSAVAGGIVGAVGGAIGGAIGGGINSTINGGDFWDGAKGGALGGALGGAFSGMGGFEGISDALGLGGEAAVDATTTMPLNAVNPMDKFSIAPADVPLEQTLLSDIGATPAPSAGGLQAVFDSSGQMADPGLLAGAAPRLSQNLGSTAAMQSTNQLGNQGLKNILADNMKISNISPGEITSGVAGWYDRGQKAKEVNQGLAGIRDRNTQFLDYGRGLLDTTVNRSNDSNARLNAIFAKYGIAR